MAKPQLLLVDRDAKSLRVLKVSLEQAGYDVATAVDGLEAVAELEREVPEVVLAATELPRLDGYGLVRRMKDRPAWAAIPVVLLTEKVAIEDKIRGLELGVDEYLGKPIFVRELLAKLRGLGARRTLDRLAQVATTRTGMMAGSLGDVAMVDLLETLTRCEATGVVRIADGKRNGEIFWRDGVVLDASLERLRGEEAVYRALVWARGRFEFEAGEPDRAAVIVLPTPALLDAALGYMAEWNRLTEALPPLDSVVAVDRPELQARLGAVPDELDGILQLLDGTRPLYDVIDESPFDDLSTLETIAKLYAEHLAFAVGGAADSDGRLADHALAGDDEAARRRNTHPWLESESADAGAAMVTDAAALSEATVAALGAGGDVPALPAPPHASSLIADPLMTASEATVAPQGAQAAADDDVHDRPTALMPGEPEPPRDAAAPAERAAAPAGEPELPEPPTRRPESDRLPVTPPTRKPKKAKKAEGEERKRELDSAAADQAVESLVDKPRDSDGREEQGIVTARGIGAKAEAAAPAPPTAPVEGAAPAPPTAPAEGAAPAGEAGASTPAAPAVEAAAAAEPASDAAAPPPSSPAKHERERQSAGKGRGYQVKVADKEEDDEEEREPEPRALSESGVSRAFFQSLPPVEERGEEEPPFSVQDRAPPTVEQLERRTRLMRMVGIVVGLLVALMVFIFWRELGRKEPARPPASGTAVKAVAPTSTALSIVTAPGSSAAAPASTTSAPEADADAPSDDAGAADAGGAGEDAGAGGEEELPQVEDPFKEATALLNQGRYKDAIPMAKAAIKADPDNAKAYMYLAEAYRALGKMADMQATYDECVQRPAKGAAIDCPYGKKKK